VEPQGLLTPSHWNRPKPLDPARSASWLVACCSVSIVLRLAFLFGVLAACTGSSVTTYDDKDPPIENGGTGNGSCSPTVFTVTPVTPYIQLMVDGSGTMDDGLGGGNSKYDSVRDALTTATTGLLNPLENKALFGVSIYTSQQTCPKLFTQACALANMTAIRNEFGQTQPQVTDPLPEAIDAMVTNFATVPAGAKKYIVLATDGVPNSCTSNTGDRTDDAVTATTAAYTAGISTYVIGLGNVPTSFLQPMANAGVNTTTGTVYQSADATALATNYTAIFNTIIDCEMTLDGTIDVAQASLGTVKSNGTALTYSTDWTAVDDHTIKLVGTACSDYNAAVTAPEITATFTCGSSH
jgi:von Willebrand factor type A domain